MINNHHLLANWLFKKDARGKLLLSLKYKCKLVQISRICFKKYIYKNKNYHVLCSEEPKIDLITSDEFGIKHQISLQKSPFHLLPEDRKWVIIEFLKIRIIWSNQYRKAHQRQKQSSFIILFIQYTRNTLKYANRQQV